MFCPSGSTSGHVGWKHWWISSWQPRRTNCLVVDDKLMLHPCSVPTNILPLARWRWTGARRIDFRCGGQLWNYLANPEGVWHSVDGRNPANHLGCIKPCNFGRKYLSTGAGFLPSTVWLPLFTSILAIGGRVHDSFLQACPQPGYASYNVSTRKKGCWSWWRFCWRALQ